MTGRYLIAGGLLGAAVVCFWLALAGPLVPVAGGETYSQMVERGSPLLFASNVVTTVVPLTSPATTTPPATPTLPPPTPTPTPAPTPTPSTGTGASGSLVVPVFLGILFFGLVLAVALPLIRSRFRNR